MFASATFPVIALFLGLGALAAIDCPPHNDVGVLATGTVTQSGSIAIACHYGSDICVYDINSGIFATGFTECRRCCPGATSNDSETATCPETVAAANGFPASSFVSGHSSQAEKLLVCGYDNGVECRYNTTGIPIFLGPGCPNGTAYIPPEDIEKVLS